MKIVSTDLEFYQTTGYLGGPITSLVAPNGITNAVLDRVDADDAKAGGTDYACIYIKNNNPSTTFQEVSVLIKSNTPSIDTNLIFALGTSAVFGTEQVIQDKLTPPVIGAGGWVSAVGIAQSIGDMPPGSWKAIWLRRDVDSLAEAYKGDGAVLTITGKTEG